MLPKITDIIAFIENDLADIRKQSAWDFSGKQVFTVDRALSKVALSLDPTEHVINQAIEEGCELLITHHPLFFHESKGIDSYRNADNIAIKAIKGGLDILSYHTNLDMSDSGTSAYICELLGAKCHEGYISEEGQIELYKVSVFAPIDYHDQIFEAMAQKGAGRIGDYERCAFMSSGVGMFTPKGDARPFIGKIGEAHEGKEIKIETIASGRYLKSVISSMLKTHPYESPAYDIIKLENSAKYGFGKLASFNNSISLKDFINLVKNKLNTKDIRTNNVKIDNFDTFAVCTGSGASMWKDCLKAGVKVLLTGDMKYHEALDAEANGVLIIDAGHQATEAIYMNKLSELLKNRFKIEIIIMDEDQHMIYWG